MTHGELIKKVAQVTGYDEDEVALILNKTIEVIVQGLVGWSQEVKLRGLGTFFWQYQKKSRRIHPTQGTVVSLPERWALKFRPSGSLKYMEVTDGEARSRGGHREGEGG